MGEEDVEHGAGWIRYV